MADPIVDPALPALPAGLDQSTVDSINQAVSAHLKRHLAGLPGMIDAAIAPLREQFGARPAADKPAGAPAAGGADDVSQLKAQLKAMQDQAAGERKASRESKAFQDLRAELAGKVRPEAVDAAAKLVFHADKRVQVADDGTITFKHGDADYSLAEGVAAYLKSPDAALFLPAPNGSAQRPGQRVPARTTVTGGAPAVESPMAKTLRLLAGVKANG
jgi:hypothetical protein